METVDDIEIMIRTNINVAKDLWISDAKEVKVLIKILWSSSLEKSVYITSTFPCFRKELKIIEVRIRY